MMRAALALSLVLAIAACGGSSNPAGPSPAQSPESTSPRGAAIHGTIAGATSGALSLTSHGAGAGMTVAVQGTGIQTTANGLGQFTLANIPAGTSVVLHFTGAGANAKLSVGTLGEGETVTLAVAVSGDDVTVQEKTRGNDKEIEGLIEAIDGTTLRVRSRTVLTTASTVIRHGETPMTLEELQVGYRVHVRGTVSGTGDTAATTATEIKVQNVRVDAPVNLQGTASNVSGSASAFEFVVQGRTVKGGSATQFKGGKSPSFLGLTNGRKVHVKGAQQNGYVQAESIVLQGK